MKDPITVLMAESEDNDDSKSLSCDLMTTYPGHSHDTYIIAAAQLVVSAKCNEQPHDLIGTLSESEARPSVGDNKGDGSFTQSACSRPLHLEHGRHAYTEALPMAQRQCKTYKLHLEHGRRAYTEALPMAQ